MDTKVKDGRFDLEKQGCHLQGMGARRGQQRPLGSGDLFQLSLAAAREWTIPRDVPLLHRLLDIGDFVAGGVGAVEGDIVGAHAAPVACENHL